MVSSTTTFTTEQYRMMNPQTEELWDYATSEGSKWNYRYQFVNPTSVSWLDQYVEDEDREFIDESSFEMPHGPTGMGERGGSGIDTYMVEGDRVPLYRFTQGYDVFEEELERGDAKIPLQREKVIRTFSFFNDSKWFEGLYDGAGNQITPGMFDFLKANIEDKLTFDCSQYTSGGTATDYETGNVQENLLKVEAYQNADETVASDGGWSTIMGRRSALAKLNSRVPSDGGTDPRDTYWNRLNTDGDFNGADVGIDSAMRIPEKLFHFEPGPDQEPEDLPHIDLTQYIGEDELIVLPDSGYVNDTYWDLFEMPQPRRHDPVQKRGGRHHVDYTNKMGMRHFPDQRYNTCRGAVHLTNISNLFKSSSGTTA